MSKVLDIITSEDTNADQRIYINGSGDSSIISYKDNGNVIGLSEGSSRFRPVHCSELDIRLQKRGYNIMGTMFIRRTSTSPLPSTGAELWYDPTKPTTQIPQIPTLRSSRIDRLHPDSFPVCGSDFPDTLIQDEYNSIFGENMNNNRNEIRFYSSSTSSINLVEDVVELELIKHDSDSYTNVLNISDLIYYNSKPGISGVFDVTVEYSKGGRIYVNDLSFQAFQYIASSEDGITPILEVTNYITEINDDVQLEYIKNTIRVNPLSSEIDECILSRCTITYGNL